MDGETGNVYVLPNILHIAIPITKSCFFFSVIISFLKFHFFFSLYQRLCLRGPRYDHRDNLCWHHFTKSEACSTRGCTARSLRGCIARSLRGCTARSLRGCTAKSLRGWYWNAVEHPPKFRKIPNTCRGVTNQLSRAYNLHNTTWTTTNIQSLDRAYHTSKSEERT